MMQQLALDIGEAPALRRKRGRPRGPARPPAPSRPQRTDDPRLPPGDIADDPPTRDDPRWKLWTAPLLELLTAPRSWLHLFAWGKARRIDPRIIRNLVAWLDEEHLVASENTKEEGWIWVGLAPPPATARARPKRADDELSLSLPFG